MDPLTMYAVATGVNAISGQRTNEANAKAQDAANRNQMAFQQKMSDTSYQRGVKDLKMAGLNASLAYGNGGASTPAGSAGAAMSSDPLDNFGSSAYQFSTMKKEMEKKQGEIDLSKQMAATQKAQERLNQSSAKSQEAAASKSFTENRLMQTREKAIKAEADFSEKENRLREKTLYLDYGAEKLNQALGLANSAKGMSRKGTKIKEVFVDPKTGEILK